MAIDILDADSDSVMRRIPSAGIASPKHVEISPDDRYLASFDGSGGSGITVFDLRTETATSSNQLYTSGVAFTRGSEQIVGMSSGTLYVYDLPDLTIDTSFFSGPGFFLNSRVEGTIDMIIWSEVPNYYSFRTYETEHWAIVDSFTILSAYAGGPISTSRADLSPDRRWLYVLGADSSGLAVFGLDMVTHATVFRRPVETSFGFLSASPAGDQVWVTQTFSRGIGSVPLHLGYLLVVDAANGATIDTFHTLGLDPDIPDEPLSIRQTFFHPNENKAFLQVFRGRPAILVFNTKTRELESSIYGESRTVVWDMRITP